MKGRSNIIRGLRFGGISNRDKSNKDNTSKDKENPRFGNIRNSNIPNNSLLNPGASNARRNLNTKSLKENRNGKMQNIESRGDKKFKSVAIYNICG